MSHPPKAGFPLSRRFALKGMGALLSASALPAFLPRPALANDEEIIRSHGYSFFGDLKYPADYPHFDYVNPDAPKGGEISLYAPGTFDSMNPYSRKGRAGRLSWMVYESLLGGSEATGEPLPGDRYNEGYGLLAESLEYDRGKTWVIFHMRPEARFADGTPVTAHDVVFSHNLFLDQGLRSYAEAVRRRVPGAEALDDHTVRFEFAEGISRRSLIDQVGGTPVFPRAWYEATGARLDEPRLEAAPGSGPYQVKSYDVNRNIVYERNPDYWGWHLPINVGRHNFDTIRIEYFADDNAAFEAFKAGTSCGRNCPTGCRRRHRDSSLTSVARCSRTGGCGGQSRSGSISSGPTNRCNTGCSSSAIPSCRTRLCRPRGNPRATNWRC
jgi:microcin C transport system substrate-binding protein